MNRSAFLASSASLVALASANGSAAENVPGGTHFVERKADFDEADFAKLVGRPADVRQMWEAVAFRPGVFNNIKNSLNGLRFGYGYAPDRIAMAFCPHGPSSAYTYTDELWTKYKIGEFSKLTDASGATITSNVFLKPAKPPSASADPDDPASIFQDTSIETLQSRGVVFLTCHTAVEEQARALVKAGNAPAGMSASDVANDILTHLIPGAHVVPSMVATVAVLQQRFHYSYVTLVM
jgi:intracellular sulfur oxidation DsrE/DsrF family protein